MIKLGIILKSAPFGTANSREGLDLLLAASAFCSEDEIAIYFVNEGVLNLQGQQQPELLLQKDFIRTFKLLALYELEQRYICHESLQQFSLEHNNLVLSATPISFAEMTTQWRNIPKLFTF